RALIFDFFGVICTYVGFDNVVVLNRELLDLIKKIKPNYKIAILSNAGQEFIEEALKQNGVMELFDIVMTSSKTGLVKPQPEIFELVLKELNVTPKEALFIDDSSSNAVAAKELGLYSVLYKGLDNLQGEFKLKNISQ
ncbi:MAG: HAD-IA family hydrolase, partial [Candidatus Doudnabacteria bacterium]|nr:HAD-IA family hydrolase [Candidatus Doudnabacteria bacterium]